MTTRDIGEVAHCSELWWTIIYKVPVPPRTQIASFVSRNWQGTSAVVVAVPFFVDLAETMTIAAWNGVSGLQGADEAWTSSVGQYTSSSPVRESPNDNSDLQYCHHQPTTLLVYEPNAKRRRLMAEPDNYVHGNNSMVLCDNMEVSTNHHRLGDITHHQQHHSHHVQEQHACPTNEELYLVRDFLLWLASTLCFRSLYSTTFNQSINLSQIIRIRRRRHFVGGCYTALGTNGCHILQRCGQFLCLAWCSVVAHVAFGSPASVFGVLLSNDNKNNINPHSTAQRSTQYNTCYRHDTGKLLLNCM